MEPLWHALGWGLAVYLIIALVVALFVRWLDRDVAYWKVPPWWHYALCGLLWPLIVIAVIADRLDALGARLKGKT